MRSYWKRLFQTRNQGQLDTEDEASENNADVEKRNSLAPSPSDSDQAVDSKKKKGGKEKKVLPTTEDDLQPVNKW